MSGSTEKMGNANALKEIGDSNDAMIASLEEGEDKKKKKKRKRHGTSGNDVEHNVDELTMGSYDGFKLRDEGKKKKRHEVTDRDVELCTNALSKSMEDDDNLNYGDKKEKKKKKRYDVYDNDNERTANALPVDAICLNNEDKKKNKKKRHDVYDDAELSANVLSMGVEDVVTLSPGDEKKKKKKGHDVIHDDVEIRASQSEGVTEGNEDASNGEREKDQRKDFNRDQESQKAKKKDKKVNNGDEVKKVKEAPKETQSEKEENTEIRNGQEGDLKKKKKKKAKSSKRSSEAKGHEGVSRTEEYAGIADPFENPTSGGGKSRKVSFSDQVEVFNSFDNPTDADNIKKDGLVRGKRFSAEEDEMIKEAVANYIEIHGLGDEGLNMVLHCQSHPEIKHCWKEIGAALPWRPDKSIYYRAHIIFQRSEERTWAPEEIKLIQDHYKKNGSDWKSVAEVLGKHRLYVKDAWRRTKLPKKKKGHWSQDEYQNLFDLVNMDLRMRVMEEKKSKHGMLRDNICWGAISDKLETRTDAHCCLKWYQQLTSPMVAEGIWADIDDYRLVTELYNLDACCIEDVDWDNLLEHRSGEACRKRWSQMVRHIGEYGEKSFAEKVEVLYKRYCPDVLEAREAYNSKPAVDP